MELIMELFLTAFVAVLISFFIAKIVSLAMGGGTAGDSVSGVEEESLPGVRDEIIMEELEFSEKLKVQSFESEKKVELVKESADKVDVFETGGGRVDRGSESDNIVECVGETAAAAAAAAAADRVDELEAGEGDADEVVERLQVQGFESEKEAEFSQETVNKVDDAETEQPKVDEAEAEVKLEDVIVEKKIDKKEVEETDEELKAENETEAKSGEIDLEESQMERLEEEEMEVKLESDSDDDWEGIEKSELEKVFGAAAKFVEHKGDLEGAGNDVQMDLYGLHKIATEGPCHEPQPLAFMVSARSKWNAWQRLGNMNPEAAMEQYVALVSDKVPGWMEENSDGEHISKAADPGVPVDTAPDIISSSGQPTNFMQERNAELTSVTVGGEITESRICEKQAKEANTD